MNRKVDFRTLRSNAYRTVYTSLLIMGRHLKILMISQSIVCVCVYLCTCSMLAFHCLIFRSKWCLGVVVKRAGSQHRAVSSNLHISQ